MSDGFWTHLLNLSATTAPGKYGPWRTTVDDLRKRMAAAGFETTNGAILSELTGPDRVPRGFPYRVSQDRDGTLVFTPKPAKTTGPYTDHSLEQLRSQLMALGSGAQAGGALERSQGGTASYFAWFRSPSVGTVHACIEVGDRLHPRHVRQAHEIGRGPDRASATADLITRLRRPRPE